MDDGIQPVESEQALSEIDRRREQVIRRKIFPLWWWWAYAVLMVQFAACFESGGDVLPARPPPRQAMMVLCISPVSWRPRS